MNSIPSEGALTAGDFLKSNDSLHVWHHLLPKPPRALDSKLFHTSSTKDLKVLCKCKTSLVVTLILANTPYKLNVMDLE